MKICYSNLPQEKFKPQYHREKFSQNIHVADNDIDCSDPSEVELHAINKADDQIEVTAK